MDTVKNFSGIALFLDRSDINTDEIIAAKYLTEISKKRSDRIYSKILNWTGLTGTATSPAKTLLSVAPILAVVHPESTHPGHWRLTALIWSLPKASPVSSGKICLTAACWRLSCRHLPSIISFNPTQIRKPALHPILQNRCSSLREAS